ncbi:MAG: sigma-70 family RNA polymerase sigma factor [Lachnospiraceae bacterium]|nr:sigma-70 family RNA polymerase sigma factor [Lachnospiraceae bacterium]
MKNKDKSGLKEIYEEYVSFIYHVVLDIVKTKENAEDITSDFFIKLWDRPDGYRPGTGHKGYMATIARNMAIDHIRKYKREEPDSGPPDGDDPPTQTDRAASTLPTPEEEVVSNLSVEETLDKLKPVYRQIITMKALSDMTFKEIAAVLEMPMGTVTWNYREAIKQLRRFGYD